MSFFQYVKDTRGELRHVAWPTQTQTVIYTILVTAISIFCAAYLGLFDYLFTSGVETALDVLPAAPVGEVNTQFSPESIPGPEITIIDSGSGEAATEGGTTLKIVPQE